MFHASILETGKNNKIIFGKRVGYPGIFFQPLQCIQYFRSNFWTLGYFLQVCFPVVNSYLPSFPLISFLLKFSGYKRKKVCT